MNQEIFELQLKHMNRAIVETLKKNMNEGE